MTTTSDTFSYLAYGLVIHTAMPLPELPAVEAEEEVSIHFGRVKYSPPEVPEKGYRYFRPTPKEDCLFWQGTGSFLVQEGSNIIIDPCPGLDERMLRILVLGPVLAILLRQRGHLILHASAVSVGDEAILFLGSSGWGKSTTAAALHARGHRLVTDDVAVLRVECGHRTMVSPGLPQLKLWPETVVSLGKDPEKLPRWNPHLEKRAHPAINAFSSAPVAIKRIYVLEEGNALEILPLQPREAFLELIRHTYGSDYGLQTVMGVGSAAHFIKCASLANSTVICKLRRQKSLSQLPHLAHLIEEDLARGMERDVLTTG